MIGFNDFDFLLKVGVLTVASLTGHGAGMTNLRLILTFQVHIRAVGKISDL